MQLCAGILGEPLRRQKGDAVQPTRTKRTSNNQINLDTKPGLTTKLWSALSVLGPKICILAQLPENAFV